MPAQPLGWYKKPISKSDDFKGMKFRTVGISIDLFQGMGAAVNALPGAEIVTAMHRALLDAAEFNNASSDRALSFADVSKVCMQTLETSAKPRARSEDALLNSAASSRARCIAVTISAPGKALTAAPIP